MQLLAGLDGVLLADRAVQPAALQSQPKLRTTTAGNYDPIARSD